MSSALIPRKPAFDFQGADPRWLPAAPAFAHEQNGASLLMPYLEPYLIQVMREARPEIERRAPQRLDDLDVFNRQEANHYRAHSAYNRILLEQYPGLDAFEAEIARDFRSFAADRSLAWNLAYCEGFECAGLAHAEFVLEEAEALLDAGDPRVAELWRWHLAEEFEHRSVAHDVLHALHPGWLRRLRGFAFCARHLFGFTARVRRFMLQLDIERGRLPSNAGRLASERALAMRRLRFMGPRITKVLMPGYDPAPRAMGERTRQVLSRYDA